MRQVIYHEENVMPTITNARDAAVKALKAQNANQLSGTAECASPDRLDSAGAMFLESVRDDVCELLESLDTDDLKRIVSDPSDVGWLDDDGRVHQLADDAPDVATYTRWLEFVDLAAWQEDTDEYGEPEDMTAGAGIALFMIAERLAQALLSEAAEAIAEAYDDDESYVDAARDIGTDHGKNAATWVEIPDADAARRILAGLDDIDPAILDGIPSPDLSGQHADGYSVAQLRDDVGAPEDNAEDLVPLSQELADAYEEGFNDACQEAIAARCRALLSDD